jgi:hypothetical protein
LVCVIEIAAQTTDGNPHYGACPMICPRVAIFAAHPQSLDNLAMQCVERLELLDGSGEEIAPADLAQNLADIARLNRLGGTTTVLLSALDRLLAKRTTSLLRIVDIGTGSGDLHLHKISASRLRSHLSSHSAGSPYGSGQHPNHL